MQNVAEPRIGITDAIPEPIFLHIAGKIAKFAVAKMPDKRVLWHKTGIIIHRQNRLQDRYSVQEKGNG